jgi:hypothetical protein
MNSMPSVGQVRLRIITEPAVEAISQEPTYSSSLAVLTASGWAVVKRVAHHEEKRLPGFPKMQLTCFTVRLPAAMTHG